MTRPGRDGTGPRAHVLVGHWHTRHRRAVPGMAMAHHGRNTTLRLRWPHLRPAPATRNCSTTTPTPATHPPSSGTRTGSFRPETRFARRATSPSARPRCIHPGSGQPVVPRRRRRAGHRRPERAGNPTAGAAAGRTWAISTTATRRSTSTSRQRPGYTGIWWPANGPAPSPGRT